jgi:hypothetical protein
MWNLDDLFHTSNDTWETPNGSTSDSKIEPRPPVSIEGSRETMALMYVVGGSAEGSDQVLKYYTGSTSEMMTRILHCLRSINLRTKSGQRQYQTQITASHNHIVKARIGEKGKQENGRDE